MFLYHYYYYHYYNYHHYDDDDGKVTLERRIQNVEERIEEIWERISLQNAYKCFTRTKVLKMCFENVMQETNSVVNNALKPTCPFGRT